MTHVTFEQAKWLKEKEFDLEVECFYSKHGAINWLTPRREYEHLHSYSEQIESYFTGKYNWNSLDVDQGMICLKTAFSESDGWCNCECSAPEQHQVIEWLRVNHGIWIEVYYDNSRKEYYTVLNGEEYMFQSPQEAYSAAFDYINKEGLI